MDRQRKLVRLKSKEKNPRRSQNLGFDLASAITFFVSQKKAKYQTKVKNTIIVL